MAKIEFVLSQFLLYGDCISVAPFGSGHIHGTYCSVFSQGGTMVRYIHQQINKSVFKNPEQVLFNIEEVTNHLRKKITSSDSMLPSSATLTLVPARNGKKYYLDADGEYWRTYLFLENSKVYEICTSVEEAQKAGRAVGVFHNQLSDYPANKLYNTIENFHNMSFRYEQFDLALQNDRMSRANSIKSEIDFILQNRKRAMILTELLEKKKLPLRVVHNDTKINNILFDNKTLELLSIIDLDTVMGGTILFDVGDLIRTSCGTVAEDFEDSTSMQFTFDRFEALLIAYRNEAQFLTEKEKDLLGESARTMTHIMAVRFLTDYLNGDVYYKIDRENHNLDRFRTQCVLIKSMDSQWNSIEQLVKRL